MGVFHCFHKRIAFLALLLFGLSQQNVIAQGVENPHMNEPCGFATVLDQLEAQYPGFKTKFDAQTLKLVKSNPVIESRKKRITDTIFYYDTIYTVPVVFHVLYNVANENLNDSLLISQIEVLNRDFNRKNPDTVKTRGIFKSRAGSARIQFVLASLDPNGVATNGMIHKPTTRATFGSNTGQLADLMKSSSTSGDDPWDPTKYLNIWVCDLSVNNQDNLLGYAFPPYGHPSWTSGSWVADNRQGVVLHYKVVGGTIHVQPVPSLPPIWVGARFMKWVIFWGCGIFGPMINSVRIGAPWMITSTIPHCKASERGLRVIWAEILV